ncbi:glutamine amidotransferase [Rhodopirellula sp. JC639]|uniref:glutamine amidotransferase n=1 Tax=Stieleria mannarensis TaxID=2755585 RepID=UPI00160402C8|nr:glutamine amidotransferase [Rhodopirellula sp. JC639]
MGTWIFAATYFSWTSPLSTRGWIALAAACVLAWFVLRTFWGRSLVSGRAGLIVIRAAAVAILIAILLGPTVIDEQAGETTRPSMIYLFDGSQSMQLGGEASRWEQAIRFVGEAQQSAGGGYSGDVQAFRFGHRLSPLVKSADASGQSADAGRLQESQLAGNQHGREDLEITLVSESGIGTSADAIPGPEASDSRLADALRQLMPQVSAKSSAGVVLLSDGRVRASESVERLSELFGKSDVPIHVVPIGQAGGSGDIAIVSLVVPSRVRKYTENELQVFLRSFGYAGQPTTVRIRRKSDEGNDLASLPITLSGGAQSASLTFRVDERAEDLVVSVDPVDGELTRRNNQVETRVEIDRTKVRVLCLQNSQSSNGTPSLLSRFLPIGGGSPSPSTSAVSIQSALQADEDVECSTLVSLGGQSLRRLSADGSSQTSGGFPRTRAELFAYDCVIFSDVTPAVLDEEQQQWLMQWIDGRGGGLIVTGASALAADGWEDSPIAPLLPVTLESAAAAFPVPTAVEVTVPNHPVWRLRIEKRLNDQLLHALPDLAIGESNFAAKTNAMVLAHRRDDSKPVMVVQRAGRGRVLVSSASLSGAALEQLSQSWGAQPERVAGKLWRNLVYWATEESSTGRRRLVVQSNQRFYRPGQRLSIRATAYDEAARRSQQYRIWAMFEPESLDDMSLYSPVLWPDNVVRESGEVAPRIAWGEELPLKSNPETGDYQMDLMLSETATAGDSGMRIELTAYEGAETESSFNHGTQVDSTSLAIQILSDPFEQQNPLPNQELMARVAAVSGGQVLDHPEQLGQLLRGRKEFRGPPTIDASPAWNRTWLWLGLIGLLSTEWVWRRISGLA